MPLVDATLTSTPNLAILFFADFADLPLRGAYAPCPIHVPTGLTDSDSDCAGFTFDVIDSKVLQVGAVSHDDGGNDTLGFSLQADPADTALMTAIENPALYAGRRVRAWLAIYNPASVTSRNARRPLCQAAARAPADTSARASPLVTGSRGAHRSSVASSSATQVAATMTTSGEDSG
jgi:hypothetical protein